MITAPARNAGWGPQTTEREVRLVDFADFMRELYYVHARGHASTDAGGNLTAVARSSHSQDVARRATAGRGSPRGRVSHPLDEKPNFMGSSHHPLPSDQPVLVALKALSPRPTSSRKRGLLLVASDLRDGLILDERDLDGDGIDDVVEQPAGVIQVRTSLAGFEVTDEIPITHVLASAEVVSLGRPGRFALALVFADPTPAEIHLLGVGSAATVVATLPGYPTNAADYNEDGITDFVSNGSLAFGQPDGTFIVDSSISIGTDPPVSGDFNGDGHQDLEQIGYIRAGTSRILTLYGSGDGHFVPNVPAYVERDVPLLDLELSSKAIRIDNSGHADLAAVTKIPRSESCGGLVRDPLGEPRVGYHGHPRGPAG